MTPRCNSAGKVMLNIQLAPYMYLPVLASYGYFRQGEKVGLQRLPLSMIAVCIKTKTKIRIYLPYGYYPVRRDSPLAPRG